MENEEQIKTKEEAQKTAELLKNREAELARKNAELDRLRAEREEMARQPKHDNTSQDISKWDDASLRLLKNSKDPQYERFKDQADEILLERKVSAIRAKEREIERREQVNATLAEKYPDATNPDSEFSHKVNRVMQEYSLDKTPAGRLAAARIVEAESKLTGNSAEKIEKDRVAALKANLTDGDRPLPVDVQNPDKKNKNLKEKILSEKDTSHEAIGEWADSVNLRERFDKVWGK